MRNCPHCNNEIQDEAVFCRFCRKDVDPPLWMTSLVKCPFCAEWVERGIERCPLCGNAISTDQPFSVELDADTDPEAEDFLAKLRTSGLPEVDQQGNESEQDLEVPTPAFIELDSEPEQPAFERTDIEFEPAPVEEEVEADRPISQPIDEARKIERTPSQPTDEGIAVLHSRRLDHESDFELDKERDTQPEQSEPSPIENFMQGPWLRWIAIGTTAIAFVVAAVLLYPQVREALQTIATPSSVAEVIPEKPTSTPVPGTPTSSATGGVGILLPTPIPTERDCYQWDEITLEMAGQSVCAFGEIRRWFQVDEIPYVAIFSEEPGTFAIIDREVTYPDYSQGTCITTTGEVEVMRGTRPFIETQGDLEVCE